MLTKKKFQGVKCVNCERDLKNLEAKPAEVSNWNKVPLDQRGRPIAMTGTGYSKRL